MQAKTKYIAIAVAVSLSMFALSTCSEKKQAPNDPVLASSAAALFECAGSINYVGTNAPNMPADVQDQHKEVASNLYELAKSLNTGISDELPYKTGEDKGKQLLQKGDRKGIAQMMQMCSDVAHSVLPPEQTQAEQLQPEDMPRNDPKDELIEEKERKEAYSQQLYQCAGIFAISSEIEGLDMDLKMMYGNASAVAWKMANKIDPNVEGTEYGLRGATQVNRLVKRKDQQGLQDLFQDCMDTADYVREHHIGGL